MGFDQSVRNSEKPGQNKGKRQAFRWNPVGEALTLDIFLIDINCMERPVSSTLCSRPYIRAIAGWDNLAAASTSSRILL
ncbi:MAG TPA: hypothetical protein DIT99_20680, partial [Candidatus Latescibacteria bacterium]|nr:hypothetical protein [Candidatus Latescibacterota bacterium]